MTARNLSYTIASPAGWPDLGAAIRLGHHLYAEIAPLWTKGSRHIAAAGETGDPDHLTRASAILTELADRERHAMQILTGIRTD